MDTAHQAPFSSFSTGTVTVLAVMRACLHAAFFVLLGVAALRLFTVREAGHWSWAALVGAALLAALYTSGPLVMRRLPPGRLPARSAARVWLALVTALWAILLLISPDFSWLAFPLFFLHLHLLRRYHAVVAVAVITGAVIAAQALHARDISVAMVLGPTLGAAFAVVIALGYSALYAESEQRRRLIDDLRRTQDELADSQHRAGALAERERLAREIHDTLAQGLSSIVLLLRSAEGAVRADPDAALARIAEARESASENLDEARGFVRGLAPPALAGGGSLPDALRRLCSRVAAASGIDCQCRVEGEPVPLPADYEVALLRAAQASLANVAAHSGASTAVVTLAYLGTEVTLDVFDNGRGFDPTAVPQSRSDGTGYGMRALRDRITALGGRLHIESAPGEGTAVAVALPFVAENNNAKEEE
ncbi:sensor histidine kinase [Nocardiopsis gilva YIM 90087]|uniref:Oxygen sensor histidine kinase NreB n=1 Tax=Nocardiopsis gilva YIM 90087 TaxID=1235441 RepID=A0A223S2H4_9ACTN|nr:sensor histidine kinase [Nocardiopsis gilva]ASU82219.1 sensor histidine kinase [Nocardiopsis gilva YIM 90087]